MRHLWMLFNQNCRTATRLVLESRERALSRLERFGLFGHLFVCRSCRRYRSQAEQIERLARDALSHPADALSADARERIERRVTEREAT